MREYVGPTRQVRHVAFMPGEPPRLAAAGPRAVHVWEAGRSEAVELPCDMAADLLCLTASADGRWLAACSTDRQRCWDFSTFPIGPPAKRAVREVLAAQMTGTDPRLVAVCRSGDPGRLRVRQVRPVYAGRHPTPAITDLPVPPDQAADMGMFEPGWWLRHALLSPDGARFAISNGEKAVHVWDVGTGQPPRTLPLRNHPYGLLFSPDGSRLLVDTGTTLYMHSAGSLELLAKWKAKYSRSPGLAWSPDGRLLARTDGGTTVRVYEVATGREVMAVGGKRDRLTSVAFSPDGLTLATGTHAGPIRVWDVE